MIRLPAQQTNPSHPQNQTNKVKFTVNNCRFSGGVGCGVCICERNVKQEQDVLSTNDGSSSTQVVAKSNRNTKQMAAARKFESNVQMCTVSVVLCTTRSNLEKRMLLPAVTLLER